jgi:hypothetical protein
VAVLKHKWSGTHDGEDWSIEVSYDRFAGHEPFVVDVWTNFEDRDGTAGAFLSPREAREMAEALNVYADMAERANQRDQRRAS